MECSRAAQEKLVLKVQISGLNEVYESNDIDFSF